MKRPGLPLGFLPGDIDPGSHCMLAYNKPDEAYIQSVVKYMTAGIASGQMCICTTFGPISRQIGQQMKKLGASLTSGQLLMPDAAAVYLPDGRFDARHIAGYYTRNAEIAKTRWNGIRVFGDISSTVQTRATRIKLLEYEALINTCDTDVISLCGYQVSALPRGYLLQIKSVHPYIASSKSMRLNRSFTDTEKFLAGLYRFRRVGKEYPATLDQTERIGSDLEESAIRTGMTLPEIDELKDAVCSIFAMIAEAVPPGLERSHVHVVYAPKPDNISVSLRYHRALLGGAKHEWRLPLAWRTVDTVHVDETGADTIITTTKRYWSYIKGIQNTS